MWASVAGVLATLQADAPGDHLAQIRARGELVWGGDIQGGEPYAFEDPADPGRVIGFEVEIVDGIARRLGVRARFRHCQWSNLVPSLERGDFDVIVNGLEATAERRDTLLLSRPYYVYAETLAIREGESYRSLADLTGRRVGTANQTFAHDLLRERPVEVMLYEGGAEAYLDLAAGRTDAVLLDNVVADRFGCAKKGIVVSRRRRRPEAPTSSGCAVATRARGGDRRRAGGHVVDRRAQGHPREVAPVGPPPERGGRRGRMPSRSSRRTLRRRPARAFPAGRLVTISLSVVAIAVAMRLGAVLAIGRLEGGRLGRLATIYVEIFRGTPVLLQLYVIYYGLARCGG